MSFDNVTWSEFWPSNQPKISWIKEPGEGFKRYRVDKFKFGRAKNETVYDDLYERFFDYTYFGTDVYYKINVLGTDKFYFIDPITSGRINTQDCFYEATPDTNDTYRDIFLEYDKKWDNATTLFGLATSPLLPVLNDDGFTNVDFDPVWAGAYPTISYVHDGAPTGERYAGLTLLIPTNAVMFTVIVKNYTKTGANDPTLVIADSAGGTERSNKVTITANGRYELLKNAAGACVLEFAVVNTTGVSHSGSLDIYVYEPTAASGSPGGGSLHDVIERVLSNASYMNLTAFSGNVVSTILWNDALPTGHATDTPAISTYITANPTYDYVKEAAAIWNNLYLGRTDNYTTDKEVNVPVSLKDVMDILKVYRFWWFIDADGKFRIEHDKYFRDFIIQADLTSATYNGDKPEVDARFYYYEKADVYSQVNYSAENDTNEDWFTFPRIDYGTKFTGVNISSISTSATTDLKYLLDSPADASSMGLILIRRDAYNCIPWDESEITAGNYYPNQRLSWAYYTDNYMDYFAEALTGENANGSHTFVHVKEFLKQDNIKFRMAADLDWKKPFTLTEGTGWLISADYEPETGMYSINVGFNPYAVDVYVVDSMDLTIGIVDDDGTTDIIL